MGGKYRPATQSNVFDSNSKQAAIDAIEQGIGRFAEKAAHRTGDHGCMSAWKSEVMLQVERGFQSIPYGTRLAPASNG